LSNAFGELILFFVTDVSSMLRSSLENLAVDMGDLEAEISNGCEAAWSRPSPLQSASASN
jgi:hypothetical protein